MVIVIPMQQNTVQISEEDIGNMSISAQYKIRWNIVDSTNGPQSQYPFIFVLFLTRILYHAHDPPSNEAQSSLALKTPYYGRHMVYIKRSTPVVGLD